METTTAAKEMTMTDNRFSRHAFGGGEAGETAAHVALLAHEAALVPGVRVRVYRGNPAGMVGVVVAGDAPGSRCVYVQEDGENGLRWAIETRNLEIVGPVTKRLMQAEREVEIAAGIAAMFDASATPRQLADYREGWHEGFRAFAGDRSTGRTPEYRAGFEAGYLQGIHADAGEDKPSK